MNKKLKECSKEYLIKQLEYSYKEIEKLKEKNEELRALYFSEREVKEDYKSKVNNAIEELEIWQPKEKILQEEKEYLLDILKGDEKKVKEKLKKYIEGLLDNNKTYVENGLVLAETDSLYSTKWLEDMCDDLLKIIDDEANENE